MRERILFLCMYTSSLFIVKVHRLLERTLATEALVRTCAVVRSSTERRGAPGVGGLYLVARQNAGGDGEDDYVVEVMYMALWHTLAQSWRLFVPATVLQASNAAYGRGGLQTTFRGGNFGLVTRMGLMCLAS